MTVKTQGEQREHPLGDAAVSIGRIHSNNIHLNSSSMSREHCVVLPTARGYRLVDLASRNGTHINGVRVIEQDLEDGDEVHAGKLHFLFEDPAHAPVEQRAFLVIQEPGQPDRMFELDDEPVTIGRNEVNRIRLASDTVSNRHAVLNLRQDKLQLEDLGSTNGTFLTGETVPNAVLEEGAEFEIGEVRIRFYLVQRPADVFNGEVNGEAETNARPKPQLELPGQDGISARSWKIAVPMAALVCLSLVFLFRSSKGPGESPFPAAGKGPAAGPAASRASAGKDSAVAEKPPQKPATAEEPGEIASSGKKAKGRGPEAEPSRNSFYAFLSPEAQARKAEAIWRRALLFSRNGQPILAKESLKYLTEQFAQTPWSEKAQARIVDISGNHGQKN